MVAYHPIFILDVFFQFWTITMKHKCKLLIPMTKEAKEELESKPCPICEEKDNER